MEENGFISEAIALAEASVVRGGGPFGALVVRDGRVIGRGSNCVTLHNDPTAHAEVQAIRDACANIGDFSLQGATLYASCEPCPMCLAASYWARLDRVVYAATREQAAAAGFDDGLIGRELLLRPEERSLVLQHSGVDGEAPFTLWRAKGDKTPY